jgi:hypothetical protein
VRQSNLILQTAAYASTLAQRRTSLLPASRTATTAGEQKIPCDPVAMGKANYPRSTVTMGVFTAGGRFLTPYLTSTGEGDGEEGKRKSPFSRSLYYCSKEGRKERDSFHAWDALPICWFHLLYSLAISFSETSMDACDPL